MKTPTIKKTLLLLVFIVFSAAAMAQAPPPPPPGQHGLEGNQEAPIGSGIGILLALGAAYGAKKVYDARKRFR
jgi:hypothetical protein